MGTLGIVLGNILKRIILFFISDIDVIDKAVVFVWILGIMQPFIAVEFSIGGAVRVLVIKNP